MTISYMGWKERLFQKRDEDRTMEEDETGENRAMLKKLW